MSQGGQRPPRGHGCPSSFSGVGAGVRFSDVLDVPSHDYPHSDQGAARRGQESLEVTWKHSLSICSEVSPTPEPQWHCSHMAPHFQKQGLGSMEFMLQSFPCSLRTLPVRGTPSLWKPRDTENSLEFPEKSSTLWTHPPQVPLPPVPWLRPSFVRYASNLKLP